MRFWRDQAIVAAICAAATTWVAILGSWPCVASSPDDPSNCWMSWPGWLVAISWGVFGSRTFQWFAVSRAREDRLRNSIDMIERTIGIKWVSSLLRWLFVVGIRNDQTNA